mgnify:CR=1 FL=1
MRSNGNKSNKSNKLFNMRGGDGEGGHAFLVVMIITAVIIESLLGAKRTLIHTDGDRITVIDSQLNNTDEIPLDEYEKTILESEKSTLEALNRDRQDAQTGGRYFYILGFFVALFLAWAFSK